MTTGLQVEQIQQPPGIFYHKLGQAKICNKKLTLVHYVNTTIFQNNLGLAEKIFLQI